jgi:hypothetical protein
LDNFIIKEITLCPKKLFQETGVSVNTAIIHLVNKRPKDFSEVLFNDCRNNDLGDYKGKIFKTKQKEILSFPDHVFNFNGGSKLLKSIVRFDKMINYLDGGLGMHTTDNKRFLAVVDYDGQKFASNGIEQFVSFKNVDGQKWKFYHKKGGDNKYYLPAEFALRWDEESRNFYNMPKNYDLTQQRQGFIISGVSSVLSARLSTPGALWESNKAMCFFSKNPRRLPTEFFVGILNSRIYSDIVKLLNHTNSIQIRDIKKIPMPDFKQDDVKRITEISKEIIKFKKQDLKYNFDPQQQEIDKIVLSYFNRV